MSETFKFNTIEEILDDLKAGKILFLLMMRTEKMKAMSFVLQSLLRWKM